MRRIAHPALAVVALTAAGLITAAQQTPAVAQPAPMISFGTPYNWTGPYAGINGGYGWGNSNYSFMPGGSGDGDGLFASDDTGGSFGQGVSGGMVGGQFGFNYQVGSLVFGLEAMMDGSNAKGKSNSPLVASETAGATYQSKMRWLATLTPRLGYAWGNILFYGKGGLAVAEMSSSLSNPGQGETFGDNHAYLGWTAGVGAEMALLGNFAVGLEYDYYGFGTQRFGGQVFPDSTFPIDYTVRQNFSTVLARVSYKFGGPPPGAAPAPMFAGFTGAWNGPTDWSGPYIGVNGGFGWGTYGYNFAPGGSGDGDALFAPDESGGGFRQSPRGGIAGGQIGFNQQWANLVLGLEATADWSGLSATSTNVLATNSNPVSYQTKMGFLGTITPRLGFAWGNMLFYAKGGLAIAQMASTLSAPNAPNGDPNFSTTHVYLGWTAGVGAEVALYQHLVVGLEYDAYGLNGQHYGGEVNPTSTWPLAYNVRPTFGTVVARISYKFGGAPVPLPEAAPMAAPAPAVVPARSYLVFFDWDKATLTSRAQQIIREAAANSTKVQYTRIEVNGYTDTSGTPQYNQGLSVRRAQAVASELVKDGVPKAAIAIKGFGETHLLVPTGAGVREPQNRRVEIIIH